MSPNRIQKIKQINWESRSLFFTTTKSWCQHLMPNGITEPIFLLASRRKEVLDIFWNISKKECQEFISQTAVCQQQYTCIQGEGHISLIASGEHPTCNQLVQRLRDKTAFNGCSIVDLYQAIWQLFMLTHKSKDFITYQCVIMLGWCSTQTDNPVMLSLDSV